MKLSLYIPAAIMLLAFSHSAIAETPAPQTPPEQAASLLLAQAQQRELALATAAFQFQAKVTALQAELDAAKAAKGTDAK